MTRTSLLDVFEEFGSRPGEFLVYDDGYRARGYGYRDTVDAARRFAARLERQGLRKGDKVVLWAENRPEWIVAFWGCLLRGVVVVPIDFRASAAFLERVRGIVEARVVVIGEEVTPPAPAPDVAVWPIVDLLAEHGETAPPLPPVAIGREDVAEIIFTSGATAEPKGVVITHGNVLANIVPIEREVKKYRKWARPFLPLRFLNLLPLSHMFGQAMATFIPPMVDGVVVFMRGYNPQEILRQARTRRVSVLVSVPKILDVVREYIVRAHPETLDPPPAGEHWAKRWWRYRKVHSAFGWKFWAFVVGAAPLETPLEEFMRRLGFVVIQGYGLTETAPIVTLNHPFSTEKGSVGKPIAGVEVKLAADGEILVRGENVTRGYYKAGADEAAAFEDGWLHTGDIGGFDAQGRLYIRGRKKEMIVTPEGLNVFPEDVERVLNEQPGVRESAVVGRVSSGEERVHAVLVLEPGADTQAILAQANRTLGDHQRVRTSSVWPAGALPRTDGTRKLRRREIRRWVDGERSDAPAPAAGAARSVEAVIARFAKGATVSRDTTLDAIGLSSLDRVELLMALEQDFEVTVDETAYGAAKTVGDLAALVEQPALPTGAAPVGESAASEPVDFPRWNRSPAAWLVRRVSLPTWILPLARAFAWLRIEGREHLDGLTGPVVFASNHQSHFDAPAILAALPPKWRYRVAIAMAKEFFKAHFFPAQHGRRAWFTNSLNYYLASLFFNAFPLPQREAGTRQTLRYIGALAEEGYSLLIFPEGRRTDDGRIGTFRPGIGMIGARLGLPVVPVRLEGLDRVLHHTWRMAKPGHARVAFGPPLTLAGDDYAALAKQVEDAVTRL